MLQPDQYHPQGSGGSGSGMDDDHPSPPLPHGGAASSLASSPAASEASPASNPSLPLRGDHPRPSSSAQPSRAGRVTPTQPSLDGGQQESPLPPPKPSGRRPSASSMQAASPPVLAEVVYDDVDAYGPPLPQAAPVAAAVRVRF